MALSLVPMSAIPQVPNHMTNAHGHSASSGLSNSKKPKLSLQTTSLTSTYGSLTRGLASNPTQAAFTPTTTNTLANTWDLSIRPSPVLRTESPRPQPARAQQPQEPYSVSLPYGVKSILKNSPLTLGQGPVSASPRDSKRKVFFPQPKKVVFRRNLEDIIETRQYVARHYDLTSSEGESSEGEQSGGTSSSTAYNDKDPGSGCSSPPAKKRKSRRDSGVCIHTTDSDTRTTQREEASAETWKNCKRRRWQRTTGGKEIETDEDHEPEAHSVTSLVSIDTELKDNTEAVSDTCPPQNPSDEMRPKSEAATITTAGTKTEQDASNHQWGNPRNVTRPDENT